MSEPSTLSASDRARVQTLVRVFEQIRDTRMRGLGLLHPKVHVQAVGFRGLNADAMLGVLITPWFVSLVLLPRVKRDRSIGTVQTRALQLGSSSIELIVGFEPELGEFASCSLYSPLDQFEDHAAVHATAKAVMSQLHQLCAPHTAAAATGAALSRRGFLHLHTARGLNDE